ncbi:MAG: ABC transporter ATP-binding protein [Variibacter sp.]|nr:ABC transporter ATP-binding protein [Variibacter sp.]
MVAATTALEPDIDAGLSLSFRSVSHAFALADELLPVLSGVDLEVQGGSFVAILGPSGCGKSTLLRLVAGLEQPRSGQILADGEPIAGPHPSRVVVFQDPTLYPWRTVEGNVALGLETRGLLRHRRDRIGAALRLVGLERFASAFPHQLSGGMAQRAALARALVNDPRLLILDEPLGKLDQLTRMTMQNEIVALWLNARFTTLMVTHDVEEALLMAQRVVIMTPRPATISEIIDVEMPYPRHRNDPRLIALRTLALERLGLGTYA